jgi:hypothetical protein
MACHHFKMKPRKQLTLCALFLIPVCFMTACQKTQNASAEQLATQYGTQQDPLQTAETPEVPSGAVAPVADQGGRNRFGFGGDEPEAPVKPLRRDTASYSPVDEKPKLKDRVLKRESSTTTKIKPPELPKPPAVDSAIVKLGFANTVPGDQLHVTLPGEYASLGPISVERMDPAGNSLGAPWARGTQMQIPNPKAPGGKIYFKVP